MTVKIMNWQFWGYGLLASFIATCLSSIELLTRYRARSLKEIISAHYFGLALLNAFFCFLVYWALPLFTSLVIKPELALDPQSYLTRALAAGIGYLVIARTSILDITTKEGVTYGAGFDVIYNGLAQYLQERHRREIRRSMRQDFDLKFSSMKERIKYQSAVELLIVGLESPEDKTEVKNRLDLANTNFPQSPKDDAGYCFTLYQILRDHTTGKEETDQRLK